MKIKFNKNLSKCTICSNKNFETILKKDRYGFKINTCVCKECGFVTINPLPTQDFLNLFYQKYYRKYYFGIKKPDEHYFNIRIGKASRRIKYISKYLRNGANILDIGSAEGAFLWLIKQFYSINETGIEPTESFSEYAKTKKLNIINQTIENINFENKKFDIITHFHVLEHIYDVENFLNINNKLLNDNGILYLEVPNILGKWKGIGMIHIGHLHNFSLNSISNIVNKTNFDILISEEFLNDGLYPTIRIIAQKNNNKKKVIIKKDNYIKVKDTIKKNISLRKENIFLNKVMRVIRSIKK